MEEHAASTRHINNVRQMCMQDRRGGIQLQILVKQSSLKCLESGLAVELEPSQKDNELNQDFLIL